MKYWFIERNRSSFRVEKMCRVLGVSRSGYYGWKKRPESRRRRENKELLVMIKGTYERSRGTYGSPRITKELQERGMRCGENRIAGIMRGNGIVAKRTKKFRATTNSKHSYPVAENLLNRHFAVEGPNRVWCSDITYISTAEGWLYLVIILDLFSRQVVGWGMSARLTGDFVIKALYQAEGRRTIAQGCIFHSDRGVQYACKDFKEVLQGYGFEQSMSRKGDCYDNAVAESFFSTLKTELVHHCRYTTRAEARQSIFEYIEIFYNRERRHSALGYRSPVRFEQEVLAA